MSKNIKEKLLNLSVKYANDNGQFHTQNPVSLKREIIERELQELIYQTKEETIRRAEVEMVNINPAYEGEALDTNNNRRWYEQGFGEYKEEIKKILNKLKK